MSHPSLPVSFLSILRLPSTTVLACLSLFAVVLSLGRIAFTGRPNYGFLNWNLFLAFVPWLLSAIAIGARFRKAIFKIGLILLWLLFFPNAPYILTDLIHLGYGGGVPLWYDLVLILSFSFAGLFFAFVSLRNIEALLAISSRVLRTAVSIALIYLSCFGIYLGRFLRWNSWDLFNNMQDLFLDIVDRIANPSEHPGTWGFTILLGTVLSMVYASYRVFGTEPPSKNAVPPVVDSWRAPKP